MYPDLGLSIKLPATPTITMALSKLQAEKRKRFDLDISESIVAEKHIKLQNKNTKKGERTAQKQFMEYLKEIGCIQTQFWEFDDCELDRHLSTFWFAARQEKVDPTTGEAKKYKVQTLKSTRHALKRFLIEQGKKFDITTDPKFRKSQIAFEDACKELKAQGYGYIVPTREISPSGTCPIQFSIKNYIYKARKIKKNW